MKIWLNTALGIVFFIVLSVLVAWTFKSMPFGAMLALMIFMIYFLKYSFLQMQLEQMNEPPV